MALLAGTALRESDAQTTGDALHQESGDERRTRERVTEQATCLPARWDCEGDAVRTGLLVLAAACRATAAAELAGRLPHFAGSAPAAALTDGDPAAIRAEITRAKALAPDADPDADPDALAAPGATLHGQGPALLIALARQEIGPPAFGRPRPRGRGRPAPTPRFRRRVGRAGGAGRRGW